MVDKVCVVADHTSEPASINVFGPGKKWVSLTPQDETLEDLNEDSKLHAPTPNFLGNEKNKIVKDQRRGTLIRFLTGHLSLLRPKLLW